MPELKIYVVRPDREEDALQYDVASTTSVGDLKSIIAAESSSEPASFHLVYNQHTLVDPTQSLGTLGITNGDFLSLLPADDERPSDASASASASSDIPGLTPAMIQQIETFRQRVLADPGLQTQYRHNAPELADAVADPRRFRELVIARETQRQSQTAAHSTEVARLNDDVTAENQAKIEEMIRLERVDAEMQAVMGTNPELFGRVTMLYVPVEVNQHPVKAFVDSGAQATIMSADCAERCGITRLIDTRWQGLAKGVGTAKILGRVHRATVRIGFDDVTCAFTVMEGKDVDMLLGLDMLKRYQACIDLHANCLRFPGGATVAFLPEGEIPKMDEEAPASDAAGPAPGLVGAAPAPASSNFQGAGRTLNSAAGAPPAPAPVAAPRASNPPAPAGVPPEHIDALVHMGASREQAVGLLQRCGGNVELAASLFFESL